MQDVSNQSNIAERKLSNRKYLIVARVGDKSLHREWISHSEKRNFDILLDYYGNVPNKYRDECDFYVQSKGLKWPGLYAILKTHRSLILQYDSVWFPDDDISVDTLTINFMFEVFTKYQLDLAQPALTRDSFFTHGITIQNPEFKLRFTDFVEVMVPLFSREALEKVWTTFGESQSGWGLDNIWPKYLGYPDGKIAIIDETPVKHTRPVGGGELYQKLNISPHFEVTTMVRKYIVLLRKLAVLSGVLSDSNSDEQVYGSNLAVHLISGAPMELLANDRFNLEYLYPNVTRTIKESSNSYTELEMIVESINNQNFENIDTITRFHDDSILRTVEKFGKNIPYMLVKIAESLFEQKQFVRAIVYLNNAIQLNERDSEALYYAALIAHLHGQNGQATKWLQMIEYKEPKVLNLLSKIYREGVAG